MISRIRSARRMILTVSLVLAVPAVAAAAVTVDNVSLKKQGEYTEITVYTSGSSEFTHEIVEPGGGKPYRVVLDLKDAVHNLPHYNFNGLPSETITSIRTSQFSVAPEKVFRLVADVKGNVTYKVKQTSNSITIAVATPNDKEFPFWCAQPLSEADRLQLALDGKPNSGVAGEQTSPQSPKQEKSKPVEQKPVGSEAGTESGVNLVSSRVSGDPTSGPKVPIASESSEKQKSAEKSVVAASDVVGEQNIPKPTEKQPEVKAPDQRAYEKMPLATVALRDTGTEEESKVTVAEKPVPTQTAQVDSRSGVAPLAAVQSTQERQPDVTQKAVTKQSPQSETAGVDTHVANTESKSLLGQAQVQTAQTSTPIPEKKITTNDPVAEPKAQVAVNVPQRNALDDTSAGVGAPLAPKDDSAAGEGEAPQQKPPALPEGVKDEDIYRMNPDSPTKTTGTLADRFPKRAIVEYESWEKADPFMPLIDQPLSGKESGGVIPDVESLRLVGVLEGVHGSSALLEDLEGYGYILKDGDPVKNGYVVQISDNRVVFQIEEYGWSRTIALRMETGQ